MKITQDIRSSLRQRITRAPRTSRRKKKYFGYFAFKRRRLQRHCGLPRSGARCALAQTIGNARGLDINSPLSTKTHAQDLRFRRHTSNTAIPTTLGGSTTTSPPIAILRQQLDYVIVDYAAPTTPHSIKAKFSSSKS
jgi:hypothetical protein